MDGVSASVPASGAIQLQICLCTPRGIIVVIILQFKRNGPCAVSRQSLEIQRVSAEKKKIIPTTLVVSVFGVRTGTLPAGCPFRQVRTCPFLAAASTRARFTIALSCVVGVSGMARVSLTRLLRAISACACSFPDILVAAVLLFLLGQLKQRSCIESGMCSQPAT